MVAEYACSSDLIRTNGAGNDKVHEDDDVFHSHSSAKQMMLMMMRIAVMFHLEAFRG